MYLYKARLFLSLLVCLSLCRWDYSGSSSWLGREGLWARNTWSGFL